MVGQTRDLVGQTRVSAPTLLEQPGERHARREAQGLHGVEVRSAGLVEPIAVALEDAASKGRGV